MIFETVYMQDLPSKNKTVNRLLISQIENNVKSLFPNYDYHVCTKIIKKYVDEEYHDYGCKYRVFKAFMYCLSDAFETIYGPTKKA